MCFTGGAGAPQTALDGPRPRRRCGTARCGPPNRDKAATWHATLARSPTPCWDGGTHCDGPLYSMSAPLGAGGRNLGTTRPRIGPGSRCQFWRRGRALAGFLPLWTATFGGRLRALGRTCAPTIWHQRRRPSFAAGVPGAYKGCPSKTAVAYCPAAADVACCGVRKIVQGRASLQGAPEGRHPRRTRRRSLNSGSSWEPRACRTRKRRIDCSSRRCASRRGRQLSAVRRRGGRSVRVLDRT